MRLQALQSLQTIQGATLHLFPKNYLLCPATHAGHKCLARMAAPSPVHIHIVGPSTPRQLCDVACRGLLGLCRGHRKRLLHAPAAQVYGGNSLVLGLSQMAQQVVERQPCKTALVSACAPQDSADVSTGNSHYVTMPQVLSWALYHHLRPMMCADSLWDLSKVFRSETHRQGWSRRLRHPAERGTSSGISALRPE